MTLRSRKQARQSAAYDVTTNPSTSVAHFMVDRLDSVTELLNPLITEYDILTGTAAISWFIAGRSPQCFPRNHTRTHHSSTDCSDETKS
jgi:hypothetical protein